MDECAGTLHFAMVGLHHVWGASRASMAQRVFTATAVLVELVGAAHACHTSGIAHMDIKPENVLIDKRGCTKLADFGHAVGNSAGSPTAALGIVDVAKTTGFTAWWAAPEVNARYSPIDAAKADVWSIGCLYFSLVMGVHPLHVDGAPEALHRRDFGGFWRVHRAAAHGSPLHDPAAESFICIAEAMLDSDPRSRVSTSVLTQAAWMKAATPAFHAELHKTLLKAIHDGTILHFSKELTLGAPAPEQSRPADPGLSVASARHGGAPLAHAAPSRIAVPSLAPAGAGPPPSAGPAAAASSAAAAGSASACAAPAAVNGRYVDAGLNQEAIKAASYTALVRCDPAAFFHQLGGFVRLLDDRATRKAGKPVRRFTHGGNAFVLQLFEREDGGEGVRIVIEAENDGMEHMARQQGRSLER
ncbi:CIPK12, partial [Symbiodinium sp. KB8]